MQIGFQSVKKNFTEKILVHIVGIKKF